MKVLFTPDYREENPYQALLADALSGLGVQAVFSRIYRVFPLTRSILAHGRFDVVHIDWIDRFFVSDRPVMRGLPVSSIRAALFLADVLIAKTLGSRIIWTVHNLKNHRNRHIWLDLLNRRLLARLVDVMKVHCQFAASEVQGLYRAASSKIAVIPLGNYVGVCPNTVTRQEARYTLGIDAETPLLLYLGKIRPYKGVFELLTAFDGVLDPQAELFIVGRPLNESIRTQLENRTMSNGRIHTVLRFIRDDEIQLYVNACDVMVLPFQDVLTSSTVLLAMSFGKAVIAPRIGCIPEVLDAQGAFLYDPKKKDGLLCALQQALGADLAAMGHHNYQLAMRLDWDGIARSIHRIYQR